MRALRDEATGLGRSLRGRRLWMVSSTANGGGVAEMMPKPVALLNEFGLPAQWVVMGTEQTEFFDLTQRLHNLIHGEGDPGLHEDDRQLYAAVSMPFLFRCHIGLDEDRPETRAAWGFLEPYA